MTTNKVCGKGKCKFTDEFCASGDCPYDTENMLKNQQNFNISDGNVKENNIFYRDCCDKFIDYVKKSHNEGVADTSKTIIVEKEVYEAVLRNSVKVADLEAENMQLRQFCEEFNALDVAEENHKLKELLKECRDNIGDDIDECTDPKIELIAKIGEVLK